jgi:hypothetical protein
MVSLLLLVYGITEAGAREAVRWTARTSLVFFGLAFAARAMPAGIAERRAPFLVCLAVSHGLHLGAIGLLAVETHGANIAARSSFVNLAGGALAYLVIGTAAFWPERPLVDLGLWWVWIVFAIGYVPRALAEPAFYGPAVALLVAMAAGRIWASARVPVRA